MLITYSSATLASGNLALRRVGPVGITCNGEPVTQVEQLFRADFATVYDRGEGPVTFGFAVLADFDSEAELLAFIATHREALPRQAALNLIDDSSTVAYVMADACRKVSFGSVRGNSVLVDYSFTGSRFTGEAVPGLTDPTTDVMKVADAALSIADESVAVVFAAAFASAPRFVSCVVAPPAGGLPIYAVPDNSTITTTGFTAKLSAPIPASGYRLRTLAIL